MTRRLLVPLLAALLVAGVGALGGPRLIDWARGTETGSDAAVATLWTTTLPDPANQPRALAQFRGKPLVINFWASWCGPCVAEMPSLSGLHKKYAARGVNFVGIAVDTPPNVQGFLGKVKVDYPVVIAGFGGGDLARKFGDEQGALPYTVVIDANGKIRSTTLGQVQPAKLAAVLDQL
jgi:thiol-disulfide isomerase/thioredoxin